MLIKHPFQMLKLLFLVSFLDENQWSMTFYRMKVSVGLFKNIRMDLPGILQTDEEQFQLMAVLMPFKNY